MVLNEYGENSTFELSEVVKNLDGALEALPEDKAQYFMWEHFTTKPYVDNGTFRRVGDCPSPWPCFVIAATDSFYKSNKNEVKKILSTLNSVTENFKDTHQLTEILAKKYQQKEKDVALWLEKTEWSQNQIKEETIKETQNQLFNLNLINKKLDFKDFIVKS